MNVATHEPLSLSSVLSEFTPAQYRKCAMFAIMAAFNCNEQDFRNDRSRTACMARSAFALVMHDYAGGPFGYEQITEMVQTGTHTRSRAWCIRGRELWENNDPDFFEALYFQFPKEMRRLIRQAR